MYHRIPFLRALCLCVQWFQMQVKGLTFVETLATFGIINATDSLILEKYY